MPLYDKLYLVAEPELGAMRATCKDHKHLVESIASGDVSGGQINHIRIGNGGKITIKPDDGVEASSSRFDPSNSRKSSTSQITHSNRISDPPSKNVNRRSRKDSWLSNDRNFPPSRTVFGSSVNPSQPTNFVNTFGINNVLPHGASMGSSTQRNMTFRSGPPNTRNSSTQSNIDMSSSGMQTDPKISSSSSMQTDPKLSSSSGMQTDFTDNTQENRFAMYPQSELTPFSHHRILSPPLAFAEQRDERIPVIPSFSATQPMSVANTPASSPPSSPLPRPTGPRSIKREPIPTVDIDRVDTKMVKIKKEDLEDYKKMQTTANEMRKLSKDDKIRKRADDHFKNKSKSIRDNRNNRLKREPKIKHEPDSPNSETDVAATMERLRRKQEQEANEEYKAAIELRKATRDAKTRNRADEHFKNKSKSLREKRNENRGSKDLPTRLAIKYEPSSPPPTQQRDYIQSRLNSLTGENNNIKQEPISPLSDGDENMRDASQRDASPPWTPYVSRYFPPISQAQVRNFIGKKRISEKLKKQIKQFFDKKNKTDKMRKDLDIFFKSKQMNDNIRRQLDHFFTTENVSTSIRRSMKDFFEKRAPQKENTKSKQFYVAPPKVVVNSKAKKPTLKKGKRKVEYENPADDEIQRTAPPPKVYVYDSKKGKEKKQKKQKDRKRKKEFENLVDDERERSILPPKAYLYATKKAFKKGKKRNLVMNERASKKKKITAEQLKNVLDEIMREKEEEIFKLKKK